MDHGGALDSGIRVQRSRTRCVAALVGVLALTIGTAPGFNARASAAKKAAAKKSPTKTLPKKKKQVGVTTTTVPVEPGIKVVSVGKDSDYAAPAPIVRPGLIVVVTERATPSAGEAVPTVIDGPKLAIPTEKSTAVTFIGKAGQTIAVSSNRAWSVDDPLGRSYSGFSALVLQDSGPYRIDLGPGLTEPALVQVTTANPESVTTRAEVGATFSVSTTEKRSQLVRVPVKGGQRYHLIIENSESAAAFCAYDWTQTVGRGLGCANGFDRSDRPASSLLSAEQYEAVNSPTFIPARDQEIVLLGSFSVSDSDAPVPPSVRGRIVEAPNDVVVDRSAGAVVNRTAEIHQSIVLPFWGTPADRGVVTSPVESDAREWGDPWIDKETATSDPQTVFATPVVFNSGRVPFVTWSGGEQERPADRTKRYGIYAGEDSVVSVGTTGEAVSIKNPPWFAAVASMELAPGDRYVVQVTGKNIRPVGLALRDPSGKFSSNRSPWQWSSSDVEQRAVTTVNADRGGRWALELRSVGDSSKEYSVSVLRVGSGGSYLGSIEVDDVLSVGKKTDVQLGPNEFARLRVKLTSATPQIIQPEVLRYRNNTFQPTAADMSIWDAKGRLVWSNNRNLEEEVLSGRLGKEPALSERFATVASADPYTLIVSPKGDLSGRFRVSVTSTPVISDVRLGAGEIPRLPGGTRTGVLEVKSPTRYRVTGTNACVSATSVGEWQQNPFCIRSGQSTWLAPGVYRFRFEPPTSLDGVTPTTASGSTTSTGICLGGKVFSANVGAKDGPGLRGVIVNIVNTQTGASSSVVTSETGEYRFCGLSVVSYQLVLQPPLGAVNIFNISGGFGNEATVALTTTRNDVNFGFKLPPGPVVLVTTTTTKPPTNTGPVPLTSGEDPLLPGASFAVVPPGTAPDPETTIPVQIDGPEVLIPKGYGDGVLTFDVPNAGSRVLLTDLNDNYVSGVLERPDGDRQDFDGTFVAPFGGSYRLRLSLNPSSTSKVKLRNAGREVQTATMNLGPKPRIFTLRAGERLELTVSIPKGRTIESDLFADSNSDVEFLYAAGSKERRYSSVDGLEPGTYRLVFVGVGNFRLTLKSVEPKEFEFVV